MPMNPRTLRPSATGFTPRSIPGLALWVDFSDTSAVTLDGNNKIQGVLDKSGLGQHGTQGTAANRLAVSTMNGRQCADNGTASNQFRVTYTAGSASNNWRDTFIVAQWDAGGTTFPSLSSPISGGNVSGASGTDNGVMLMGNNASSAWFTPSVMTRSFQTNGSPLMTGGGASLQAFRLFGGPFIFRGNAPADVSVDGWSIGNDRGNFGRGWRGRVGEVISYSRPLSAGEAARVTRYLASKWGVTLYSPPAYADADVNAYITAVEIADGNAPLEAGVRNAINDFITGCKADGIWSAIKASCILAGARTLAGALTPLVGTAPTNVNNNFVSGDYNRKTGLVGDGTTKFLDTNTNNNSLGQNDAHMAVYVSSGLVADAAARGIIGTTNATGSSGILKQNTDVILTRLMHSGAAAPTPPVGLTGLIGVSRNASASYSARGGGVAATVSATSQTPQSESILVFRTGTSHGVHRMAFYSAGNALSLALLDARVTALINAIGAAIP